MLYFETTFDLGLLLQVFLADGDRLDIHVILESVTTLRQLLCDASLLANKLDRL